MRALLSLLLIGAVYANPRLRRDSCEEARDNYQECVTGSHSAHSQALGIGDDGKPDFYSRKSCNYVEAVMNCGDLLIGDCFSSDQVSEMKNSQLQAIVSQLEQAEEWDSQKCPKVKEWKDSISDDGDDGETEDATTDDEDFDNDGIVDDVDNDDDNDGVPDDEDNDDDNDGIADDVDDDDDNDGVPDEEDNDDDGDGIPDDTDDDADNDGVPDDEDNDDDGDGVPDDEDNDDDNDGVPDDEEDVDEDGEAAEDGEGDESGAVINFTCLYILVSLLNLIN